MRGNPDDLSNQQIIEKLLKQEMKHTQSTQDNRWNWDIIKRIVLEIYELFDWLKQELVMTDLTLNLPEIKESDRFILER